ncbi:MAG TPA: penicillin-binding protein [Pseudogracilibacillus sp.]|nr:penicillin-binding protein [Pseudogracilibacillus sp.]
MKKNKKTNIVATIGMVIFLAIFLIITGRFLYIQITGEANDVALLDWAEAKRSASMELEADRGKIYDHNGMILAYNRPTYNVYAVLDEEYTENQPEQMHVTDTKKTAEKLAPLLDMKPGKLKEKLDEGIKEGRFQTEFGTKGKFLTEEEKEDVQKLELPGIYLMENASRYYPNGMFASHIIGFAKNEGKDNDIVGKAGMEKEENKLLNGKNGHLSYHRDKHNKKLLNSDEVIEEPENGKEIYLTIDQKIQTLLEDVLSQVDDKYNPKRITATMMNAKTGEILAMSSRPSYNPNEPNDIENWFNDAVSTPVEPGSTMKIFTWAAAIDSDSYNGDEFYESGQYKINERVQPINDHNQGEGWGTITFDEGFRRSSNVAASKLVWEKMGEETFLDYLQDFDFEKETGIDLPSEVAGKISYNYPSDKLRTAFGQSSTMTPIQQMKAASAISNKGKMLRPYVIDKIVDPDTDEVIEQSEPKVVGEPISEDTADKVVDLMASVVNEKDGTGHKFKLDDYSMAGKTGTAQIPNDHGKGYMQGRENNIFSFIGMAPEDDPEILMHVSVTQPSLKDTDAGSDATAFIIKNVMSNALHYLNIEPDKDDEVKKVETIEAPETEGKNTKKVKKDLKDAGVETIVVGDGKKVKQANITPGEKLYKTKRVILITDKPVMPNIKGWSQRDATKLADMLGLDVEIEGSGFVTKQSIKPDTKIKDQTLLKLELKPPNQEEE